MVRRAGSPGRSGRAGPWGRPAGGSPCGDCPARACGRLRRGPEGRGRAAPRRLRAGSPAAGAGRALHVRPASVLFRASPGGHRSSCRLAPRTAPAPDGTGPARRPHGAARRGIWPQRPPSAGPLPLLRSRRSRPVSARRKLVPSSLACPTPGSRSRPRRPALPARAGSAQHQHRSKISVRHPYAWTGRGPGARPPVAHLVRPGSSTASGTLAASSPAARARRHTSTESRRE